MRTSIRRRYREVLSGIGFGLALLAAIWLGSAILMAALIPGHWGDVVRIASACVVAGIISVVLVRTGRSG
jgi:hypothetical protein